MFYRISSVLIGLFFSISIQASTYTYTFKKSPALFAKFSINNGAFEDMKGCTVHMRDTPIENLTIKLSFLGENTTITYSRLYENTNFYCYPVLFGSLTCKKRSSSC